MILIVSKKIMLTPKKLFATMLLVLSMAGYADVVAIIHPDNDNVLDKTIIKQIFMGRIKQFPNGEKAVPIEISSGPLRSEFMQKYLGKRDAEVQSYWSRQLFAGKGTPPKGYDKEADVKKLVAANPNVIGFIDAKNVDASVKVVNYP